MLALYLTFHVECVELVVAHFNWLGRTTNFVKEYYIVHLSFATLVSYNAIP